MFSDMVFPFNLVKQGARIVIYGAGNVGKCYYFQLKKTQFCKVVHWVDKKYEDYRFEGLDVEDVEGLRYWDDYDYIVVAVRETPVLEDVLKYLDNIKVSKKQIICWEPYYQEDWGYKTRLSLENILPPQNIDKSVNINSHESKIKVRILFEANTFWNVWEPLCKAYMSDERYDLCVIGWGDYKRKELLAYRENIPFVYDTDYDLKIDNPDIVFLSRFVNPSINLRELRKYSKLIVALWFGLMKWFGSVRRTLYSFEKTVELASPDFYIFDKYLYDEIANSEIENNGKYIFSGNTKFDYLYEKLHSPVKYPSEWGKIDDKCVFLIAPDHVWDGRNVTFDLYASEIFKYANENRNVAFILRMHPAYIEELLNNNIWTDTDIVNIKKYCLNSENLIWDEIKEINKQLPGFKKIKELIITTEPLEKTTTQKIRRFKEFDKILGDKAKKA